MTDDEDMLTFIDLHICNRLPFIHSHKPSVVFPPTTEIDDKFILVAAQSSKHRVEPHLGELP